MKTNLTFWMVWTEHGGTPTMKHTTYDSAETEAIRLARANPNKGPFHVLCAVASYNVPATPVEKTLLGTLSPAKIKSHAGSAAGYHF